MKARVATAVAVSARAARAATAIALVVAVAGTARAGEATGGRRLKVVTTLPVLASVTEAVGGSRVEARSLAMPFQDPHFVQPRPTLMKSVREADVFIENGLGLELWAEKVLVGSGNTRVQAGTPGHIVASAGIATLELPAVLSREWGDVHPQGNPHLWLDPIQAERMAANIAAGLSRLDPAGAADYRSGLEAFESRLDTALFGESLVEAVGARKLRRLAEAGELFDYLAEHDLEGRVGGWLARLRPLRGRALVSYHKTWIYFATRFGLRIPIELEDKPGITPSARHRDAVIATVEHDDVAALILAPYYDRRIAEAVSERTGVPVVVLPVQTGAEDSGASYEDLIDAIVARLSAGARP